MARNRVDEGGDEYSGAARLTAEEKASLRQLADQPDLWSRGECLKWLQREVYGLSDAWQADRDFAADLLTRLAQDQRPEVWSQAQALLAYLQGTSAREAWPKTEYADRVVASHPFFYSCEPDFVFNASEQESLRRLAASPSVPRRLSCGDWIDIGHDVPENLAISLEILERLAQCPRGVVRFQALGLLDHFPDHPAELWPVLARLATSRLAVRGYLGPFVLEHFLEPEASFHTYFPRIAEAIERGDRRWLIVLDGCYRLGHAAEHEAEIDDLLLRHGVEPRFTHLRPRRER